MGTSTYFNKHYDASMARPFKIGEGTESVPDLASSMNTDLKDNHFDGETVKEGLGAED